MTGAALPLTVLRLAARDVRGGLSGFWVFLLCLALGVTAIVGVGATADGLSRGLARQGRVILGGDASFARVGAPPTPGEAAGLAARGRPALTAGLRAMARAEGGAATLVEVKAVDGAYPLAGTVGLEPAMPLADALAPAPGGAFGLVADATLAARLDVKPGDTVRIGAASFLLRATLASEPDKLASGIALGPRVIMSLPALTASELAGEGSLVRWATRLDLGRGGTPPDDAALKATVDGLRAAFPEAGWEVRTRGSVSPEFDRNLGRFTQFLTLVGLTALVVGGVGVANAVRASVEAKRASLAVLKAVGATGGTVFAITLAQVLAVAAIGIAAGLMLGAALPFAIKALFGTLIPFPLEPVVEPRTLLQGAAYGLLTALAFSLGALGRAHDIPVSALFRDAVDPDAAPLRWRYRLMVLAAVAALVGTVFLFTPDMRLSAIFVAGTAVAFALLRGVAWAVMRGAAALPRPRGTAARLALANIHRPGALTPSVVLSLGLGLTLLVTLALIDSNIRRQIGDASNGAVPSFFFADIPGNDRDAFRSFVEARAPGAAVSIVPMLRGRITAIDGVPADQLKPESGSRFALEGDRGVTTAAVAPEGSTVTEGAWWAADYAGKPLVSFDATLAKGLGIKLGSAVTVNVLGRPVTATVASLRRIEWEKLGINFFMVFSPNTFAGAPHSELATATFPTSSKEGDELALLKAVAGAWPTVTVVRVKDVLVSLNHLIGQLALAVRGASGVAVATSVLVLAGALAAGRRARVYDAVILKVLGATRRRLLGAMLIEYAVLGLVTALFAVAAGSGAAAVIVVKLMDFRFGFAWGPVVLATAAALAVTVGLGLAGTWRILGEKPARYLRAQ